MAVCIDAVEPVAQRLPSVPEALDNIFMTCSLTSEVKSEASSLKNVLCHSIISFAVWLKVLQCVDDRNENFQSGKILTGNRSGQYLSPMFHLSFTKNTATGEKVKVSPDIFQNCYLFQTRNSKPSTNDSQNNRKKTLKKPKTFCPNKWQETKPKRV